MSRETEEFESPVLGNNQALRRARAKEALQQLWRAGRALADGAGRLGLSPDTKASLWIPDPVPNAVRDNKGKVQTDDAWVIGKTLPDHSERGDRDYNVLVLSRLGWLCVTNVPQELKPTPEAPWPELPVPRHSLVPIDRILDVKDPRMQGSMTPADMIDFCQAFNDMNALGVELPELT